jgi:hypothetical protein
MAGTATASCVEDAGQQPASKRTRRVGPRRVQRYAGPLQERNPGRVASATALTVEHRIRLAAGGETARMDVEAWELHLLCDGCGEQIAPDDVKMVSWGGQWSSSPTTEREKPEVALHLRRECFDAFWAKQPG